MAKSFNVPTNLRVMTVQEAERIENAWRASKEYANLLMRQDKLRNELAILQVGSFSQIDRCRIVDGAGAFGADRCRQVSQ